MSFRWKRVGHNSVNGAERIAPRISAHPQQANHLADTFESKFKREGKVVNDYIAIDVP